MANRALTIVKKLRESGFAAYFVGGAARDIVMGCQPKDYDIATSAKPEDVEKLFKKTIGIGKKFGVVVVVLGGKQFEVATFRQDRGSTDGRRPDKVKWASENQDVARRDFTVNALLYDPIAKKIIDHVGGQKDIQAKIIRFIGDPQERIKEDNLRLLRCVRFKNMLGFDYDQNTWLAVKDNGSWIASVSAERVRDELNKMFVHPSRANSLWDLDKSGLLAASVPEIDALHGIDQSWKFYGEGDVFTHTWLAIGALPLASPLELVWATLLHDIGKPATKAIVPDKRYGGERIGFYGHHEVGAKMARKILERLRFARDQIELIVWLVRHHMMVHEILEMREGRKLRWLRDTRLPLLLELHRADASGKQKRINLDGYHKLKKLMEQELAKPPPPPKLLGGDDIMREFKLKAGPKIGELLKLLKDAVWDGKVKTREGALEFLRKVYKGKSAQITNQIKFIPKEAKVVRQKLSKLLHWLADPLSNFPLSKNYFGYIFDELAINILEHAQAASANIEVQNQEKEFTIVLTDNGRGIFSSLKERFSEIDSSEEAIKKALEGYSSKSAERGFGLRTTKKLVELAGGSFKLTSSSQGTQVQITLPKSLAISNQQFYEIIEGKL